LVEVVGSSHIDVVSDRHLSTFVDGRNAEDHHRHLAVQPRSLPDARGARDYVDRPSAETDQNQVWTLAAGPVHGVIFVASRIDAVAVCREQLLDAVAGLLDIVRHQDACDAMIFVCGHCSDGSVPDDARTSGA